MADPQIDLVVAGADPELLKKLSDNPAVIQAFTDRGGWLMLWA